MNAAYLHLIVNHVSLFCLVIGVGALIASMKRKSVDLRVLATVLFVIAAVFGWISVETGHKAAHFLETLSGTSSRASLAMEWAACKKKTWFKPLQWALLIFALHGVTVFARTAYLGGLIHHTEIRGK